jgi:hypothetical protein
MLAPVIHIIPLTNIRRERLLPVAGKVLVRANQKVASSDIIAEARLSSEHLLVDVARGLGITPEKADKLIERKVGEQVTADDILAGPVGSIARRIMRAPQEGTIVAIGGGQILLELKSAVIELRAGLPGLVSELIPERGAIIECTGALIQGVWGNNKIEAGVMYVLARNPEEELLPSRMDVSLRGAIVVAGPVTQAEVLQTAAEIHVRALVVASLAPDLISLANQSPLPIMVLEGFGKLPFTSTSYKILSTNDKREICVNTNNKNRFTATHPEIIIPLPAPGTLPNPRETDIFAPGQIVRITQAPLKGKVATLVSLRPGLTSFPSGLRARAAVVRLENEDQATVPLANLEVIE